ncbi:MAG: lysine--tRNA ligase [Candidatus Omnitrophica bacterium]|nr:lysine--tRNA ligase [Candidatus Omnitrophota bacterium]
MSLGEQRDNRHQKLTTLRQQGIAPFSERRFEKPCPIAALAAQYAEGRSASTAGRLSAKRGHGGLVFADLRDGSGKIQICVKQDAVSSPDWALFDTLDLGDIVGVRGTLFKTKTGEATIQAKAITLLAKALRPLPEKWHGLKDIEIRYRQRYLDLIANEPVRQVFIQRGRLMATLRQTLEREGFLEVETPMMHAIPGGAAGEPFVTHHHALDENLYLRLAPELHLKELLVGGFDRVYELNRSFRNEGVSTRHNPEFTMLEAYAAYQDCAFMMGLVERLIVEAAKALRGTLRFEYQGQPIDLTPPWDQRASFAEAMQAMNLSPTSSIEEIQAVLAKRGMKLKGVTRSQLVRLVEQLFEPKAQARPLFVVDYWTELSPLAKSKPEDPLIADRFELFIGGMEVANAYSELNDPVEQRRRFEAQLDAAGVKGKARRIDEGFVEALEHGMPPAGGLGVGVDRLAMLLLDQPSIKDVILFPLLKPSST